MRLFICGDSIAADYPPEKAPQTGWGQVLGEFLPGYEIINRAVGARSTKSFISEGRLSRIETELERGDMLLVQFAHNDENPQPMRYCEAHAGYKHNLKLFIDTARAYGAVPVIMSPICMRVWQDGLLKPTHGEYPDAARQIALETGAWFIDMYAESYDIIKDLGEDGSAHLFMEGDFAHTNHEGARTFARIIAEKLTDLTQNRRFPAEKPTCYICGDSIAASYAPEKAPMTGWGQVLECFTTAFHVDNRAVNGRSSKSFTAEGRLSEIETLLKPGDVLLTAFSHNDEKPDRLVHTNCDTTFKDYLNMYIDAARRKGAVPVLMTPMPRRRFDKTGALVPTHGAYPDAIRTLAHEKGVALIELEKSAVELLSAAGPEGSKRFYCHVSPGHPNYPEGAEDNSHLCEYGAKAAAKLIANALEALI